MNESADSFLDKLRKIKDNSIPEGSPAYHGLVEEFLKSKPAEVGEVEWALKAETLKERLANIPHKKDREEFYAGWRQISGAI